MRITMTQLQDLRDALDAAKLGRCSVRQDAQDAMKNYLNTWVVDRLERVIEQVEKTK